MRLTGDTLSLMDVVSVRELRNHGGEVLDRVARGEALILPSILSAVQVATD